MHDLFDTAAFMPHGYCLLWLPWLIGMHVGADVLIFLAYSAIPIAIWIFLRQGKDLELWGLAVLFAAFILLCGLTHLIQAITLWLPIYEFQGWVKVITAIVSVGTAILIFPLVPKALAIPSPRMLQAVNLGLEREVASHLETCRALETAKLELEQRVLERTEQLRKLNEELEERVRVEVAQNREKDHLLIQQSRLAAMGEMVHNIAHQWRQPLNSLGLVISNLYSDIVEGVSTRETLDQDVAKARGLIDRMSTTIDDFRDFFRPYRAALGLDVGLDEIRRGRGTAYAPEVVDACFEVFERSGGRFWQ